MGWNGGRCVHRSSSNCTMACEGPLLKSPRDRGDRGRATGPKRPGPRRPGWDGRGRGDRLGGADRGERPGGGGRWERLGGASLRRRASVSCRLIDFRWVWLTFNRTEFELVTFRGWALSRHVERKVQSSRRLTSKVSLQFALWWRWIRHPIKDDNGGRLCLCQFDGSQLMCPCQLQPNSIIRSWKMAAMVISGLFPVRFRFRRGK